MKVNSSKQPPFFSFTNDDALAQQLAEDVAVLLAEDIADSSEHRATLAVSGGRTPIKFFHALSHCAIEWQKVLITLIDERWVDNNHKDSNEKLVRDHLLQNQAAEARFLSLKNPASTATEGEALANQQLAHLPERLSVAVLGLGEDGHTASLFPDSPQLSTALNPENTQTCFAMRAPSKPEDRMTLSLSRILASKQIFLHIAGEKKLQVYQDALEPGSAEALPIRAIIHQTAAPLSTYWNPS